MSTAEWIFGIEVTIITVSAVFSIVNTWMHWGNRRYPCNGSRHRYMKKLPKN
jgi:hypothetical protein